MRKFHTDFDRLDLNLLRLFEVIYRERSLSKASDILGLTPSAISHALKRLREQLDDPLFLREGRDMVPTPACLQIADEILDEVARLRSMVQRWGNFDPKNSTATITIVMPDAMESSAFPAIVAQIAPQAPNCRLVSRANDRRNIANMLQNGTVDLAIDVTRFQARNLHRKLLQRSNWRLVMGEDLHDEALPYTLQDYKSAQHVEVSHRAFGAVLEDLPLAQAGITRDVRLRTQTYLGALDIVRKTDHILTMPSQLTALSAKAIDGLKIRDLPFQLSDIEIFLYWHPNRHDDAMNCWLREQLEKVFPSTVEKHV